MPPSLIGVVTETCVLVGFAGDLSPRLAVPTTALLDCRIEAPSATLTASYTTPNLPRLPASPPCSPMNPISSFDAVLEHTYTILNQPVSTPLLLLFPCPPPFKVPAAYFPEARVLPPTPSSLLVAALKTAIQVDVHFRDAHVLALCESRVVTPSYRSAPSPPPPAQGVPAKHPLVFGSADPGSPRPPALSLPHLVVACLSALPVDCRSAAAANIVFCGPGGEGGMDLPDAREEFAERCEEIYRAEMEAAGRGRRDKPVGFRVLPLGEKGGVVERRDLVFAGLSLIAAAESAPG